MVSLDTAFLVTYFGFLASDAVYSEAAFHIIQ